MVYSLSLVLAVCLIAPRSSTTCLDRQSIAQSLTDVHIPGAAIIVVNATSILYEQAFGYHSLSPSQPMDINNSIFTLASISKTFIAIAVMQLVQKEYIDLDTDINRYLSEPSRSIYHPSYPTNAITLRKLLSHTASIAVDPTLVGNTILPDDTALAVTLGDLLFTLLSPNASNTSSTSNWLPMPPGTVSLYSNEGSALAALVVERVANMSYDEYVKEMIFKPLNVTTDQIGIRLSEFPDKEKLVKAYAYITNVSAIDDWTNRLAYLNITQSPGNLPTWINFPFFSIAAYPAALFRTSAHTLSIFLRMFISNGSSLLTPRSIAEIKLIVGGGLIPAYGSNSERISTKTSSESQYGLIWTWQALGNGDLYIGHSGSAPGSTHLMLVNEQQTIGVIVLTNSDITAADTLSDDTFETIQNIHVTLFRCFEPNNTKSKGFRLRIQNILFILTAFIILPSCHII